MLYNTTSLTGYKLKSLDGEIGKVKQIYFNDRCWTVRYLVAETGNWLKGRQVLISPYSLGAVNAEEESISVNLTSKQIEDSPIVDSDKPVSRQYEKSHMAYFGFSNYWDDQYVIAPTPISTIEDEKLAILEQFQESWDPNLRSTKDVTGLCVEASDGEIGQVADFVIDDETWSLRYLVVDTGSWYPGKKVLIPPQWTTLFRSPDAADDFALLRDSIQNAPEYCEGAVISREFETELYQAYNRNGYWVEDPDESKSGYCDCN